MRQNAFQAHTIGVEAIMGSFKIIHNIIPDRPVTLKDGCSWSHVLSDGATSLMNQTVVQINARCYDGMTYNDKQI